MKVTIPTKLHYALDAGQRQLNIRNLPAGTHRYAHDLRAGTYVHLFLRYIKARPTYEGEPGATWIELLIAFEAHGRQLQVPINERATADMALPTMTTRQLQDKFKKLVKFIMETCSDDIDAKLFRTSQINGTRLRSLAIQHAVPSVNCMPIWPNDIAFIITQAILKQKRAYAQGYVQSTRGR